MKLRGKCVPHQGNQKGAPKRSKKDFWVSWEVFEIRADHTKWHCAFMTFTLQTRWLVFFHTWFSRRRGGSTHGLQSDLENARDWSTRMCSNMVQQHLNFGQSGVAFWTLLWVRCQSHCPGWTFQWNRVKGFKQCWPNLAEVWSGFCQFQIAWHCWSGAQMELGQSANDIESMLYVDITWYIYIYICIDYIWYN